MIKTVSATALAQLSAEGAAAPRRRAHLVTHANTDALVQRMYIALAPDTYIRPHRHTQPHKHEFFLLIAGALDLLVFDDAGAVTARHRLAPDAIRSVEIPPHTWHAYVCTVANTLGFEIKEGPYDAKLESEFASWAPEENSADSSRYLEWMRTPLPE